MGVCSGFSENAHSPAHACVPLDSLECVEPFQVPTTSDSPVCPCGAVLVSLWLASLALLPQAVVVLNSDFSFLYKCSRSRATCTGY